MLAGSTITSNHGSAPPDLTYRKRSGPMGSQAVSSFDSNEFNLKALHELKDAFDAADTGGALADSFKLMLLPVIGC